MPLKMDGYELVIGDPVFDLVFGLGHVDRLVEDEDRIWVTFGGGLRSFNSAGFGNFSNRTLFWRSPITAIPHKNDDAWDKTSQIALAVSKILGRK